jgi:hypothetical protein
MRRKFLWLLLFAAANLLLLKLHSLLFQSAWPFSAWGSIAGHVAALLFFPYTIFTPNSPK